MFPGIDPEYRRAKFFTVQGLSNTSPSLQKYIIPPGARLLYFIGCGGGGGGGGGCSGPTGTNRGGGSGTALPPIVHALMPTALVPGELLVEVGRGGIGGAADNHGTPGVSTKVLTPFRNNLAIYLDTGYGFGGAKGTSTATAGGTNMLTGFFNWPIIGQYINIGGGINGAVYTGGASSNNGSLTNAYAHASGGSSTGTNDVSYGSGNTLTLNRTVPGATGAGGNGNDAVTSDPFSFFAPYIRTGATGGASNGTGTGGNGGNGIMGTSGASGGGGVIGGKGGNGGDGFLIVVPIF